MDTTPTPPWGQRYTKLFLAVVIGGLLFVMVRSLGSGLAGFEDGFFGRRRLIAGFNRLRYTMGDRVFPQVVVGKDGWLEYLSSGNMDDYQNALLLPDLMERIQQGLDGLNEELAARGTALVVVVVPNKATIYPETLSDTLEKLHPQSRLDLFLELAKDSPYVIDLRPALLEQSREYQLYYKTDTHWNALGAYLGYAEVLRAASRAYPELQPYELDRFRWSETEPKVMDLARVMGVDFLREPWKELTPKFDSASSFRRFPPLSPISMSWANNGQGRTMLMYHDSFGVALQGFFRHHFKQAMYVLYNEDPAIYNLSWIEITRPDLVIVEVSERNLPVLDALLSSSSKP